MASRSQTQPKAPRPACNGRTGLRATSGGEVGPPHALQSEHAPPIVDAAENLARPGADSNTVTPASKAPVRPNGKPPLLRHSHALLTRGPAGIWRRPIIGSMAQIWLVSLSFVTSSCSFFSVCWVSRISIFLCASVFWPVRCSIALSEDRCGS